MTAQVDFGAQTEVFKLLNSAECVLRLVLFHRDVSSFYLKGCSPPIYRHSVSKSRLDQRQHSSALPRCMLGDVVRSAAPFRIPSALPANHESPVIGSANHCVSTAFCTNHSSSHHLATNQNPASTS